jgi:predicted amidohydrolase
VARYIDVATIHFSCEEAGGASDGARRVLEQFRRACDRLDGTGVDLVVTCEGMESCGQTVETAESADRYGPMLSAYADFARRNHCCVAGSVKLKEQNRVYNALAIIGRVGEFLGDYRKTYLTKGEYEKGISPGQGAHVIETPVGRIGGAICFDLNFADLRLQYPPLKPDLIAFSSMYHGGFVQQVWAYETRNFIAAACKDILSEIRDPLGRSLAASTYYTRIARARLNLDRAIIHVDFNMERFADMYRRYGADVRIDVMADIGVALLYSEGPKRTVEDLLREFELTTLDAYLEQSRTSQRKVYSGAS